METRQNNPSGMGHLGIANEELAELIGGINSCRLYTHYPLPTVAIAIDGRLAPFDITSDNLDLELVGNAILPYSLVYGLIQGTRKDPAVSSDIVYGEPHLEGKEEFFSEPTFLKSRLWQGGHDARRVNEIDSMTF